MPASAPRAGIGVREVRAPGVALRRRRRRGARDGRERHVHRGARRARRPAAARAARAGGRAGADRQAARPTTTIAAAAARGRRATSATTSPAISSRRPSTARRWRRCTSKRALPPRRARARVEHWRREPAAAGKLAIPASVDELQQALGRRAVRRRARARRSRSIWRCGCKRPLFLEGEAGRRQDRGRQGAGGRARHRADPPAVLRGPRRQPRGLRVELPAADPRDPAARRPRMRSIRGQRRARAVHRGVPDQAAAAARASSRRASGRRCC